MKKAALTLAHCQAIAACGLLASAGTALRWYPSSGTFLHGKVLRHIAVYPVPVVESVREYDPSCNVTLRAHFNYGP